MSLESRLDRLEHPDGQADDTEARVRDDINMQRWWLERAASGDDSIEPPEPAYEGALSDPESIRCWMLNGFHAAPRQQAYAPGKLLYAHGHPLRPPDDV